MSYPSSDRKIPSFEEKIFKPKKNFQKMKRFSDHFLLLQYSLYMTDDTNFIRSGYAKKLENPFGFSKSQTFRVRGDQNFSKNFKTYIFQTKHVQQCREICFLSGTIEMIIFEQMIALFFRILFGRFIFFRNHFFHLLKNNALLLFLFIKNNLKILNKNVCQI